MEGSRALAAHYGFKQLLSMDVGGTTTDIGVVENGAVRADARGKVEGVTVSFPLCDVVSVGVGGSSIIKADGKTIRVGHRRSEEHTSELQSLMRISYAVFCLKKKTRSNHLTTKPQVNKDTISTVESYSIILNINYSNR